MFTCVCNSSSSYSVILLPVTNSILLSACNPLWYFKLLTCVIARSVNSFTDSNMRVLYNFLTLLAILFLNAHHSFAWLIMPLLTSYCEFPYWLLYIIPKSSCTNSSPP